jgi:transposase InsO family protein
MIAFIDAHRGAYGVEPICRVLPIAPSTYREHAAKRRNPSRLPPRALRDLALKPEILRVFCENFGVYGVRKVWRQMRREDFTVARCTVERLMRDLGLQVVIRGKPVRTTVSDKRAPCPLDQVNRQFHAPAPNRLWVSDFTYVTTWAGFVYVAFVIDVYARHIVGWQISRTAHPGFVLDALEQAIHERRPAHRGSLVHHSAQSVDQVHRAPRRGRHRALGRQRRRQLRQRLGQDHQRPLQGRGDSPARAVAIIRSRGICDPGMG